MLALQESEDNEYNVCTPFTPTPTHPPITTPGTTPQQLTGTTSHRLTSDATLLRKQLKNFFGQLLESSRSTSKQTNIKQLTGIGESLTSDEAMDRLKKDEEKKKD